MQRRLFLKNALCAGILTGFPLRGFATEDQAAWQLEIHELSRKLIDRAITPQQWQAGIEQVYHKVQIPNVLSLMDIEEIGRLAQLTSSLPLVYKINKTFGPAKPPHVQPRVMFLKKGTANTPHGHVDMVSAHLIIKGRIRVRTFNLIHLREDSADIQLTNDKIVTPGEVISMSEQKDNIHWFQALEDSATMNVPICNLKLSTLQNSHIAQIVDHRLLFFDTRPAEKSAGRAFAANIISREESVKKFGVFKV